ncbi:hypothetical protein [Paenibacillus fonticola]|uniref:hypothetical protein n=1 Tax=Paenibacillus fonticola TaxID=379896 RepID=UPI000380805E|nr:hypothetical protein [Paenibacillus fonticola]
MPGVAVHGSEIYEVRKPGYVTYEIWTEIPVDSDEYGNPIYRWTPTGSGSRNAKITGYIVASSKMKVGGANVAVVGDKTIETWVADPPVPSSDSSTQIRNIQPPGGQGSGEGEIISGSTKAKLDGKPIALIGSTVRTCLGTTTTIKTGSDKLKFSS